MSRKKTHRSVPVSRSPLFQDDQILPFDDPSEVELLATLTPEQRMDKFMSKYMELVDPFTVYATYFEHAIKTDAHVLLDVKRNYRTFVLEDEWTEQKYVAVIDGLFRSGADVNQFTLQSHGAMFDSGKSPLNPSKGTRRLGSRRPNRSTRSGTRRLKR